MKSLRLRLMFGITAGVAVLLAVFCIFIYSAVRSALYGEMDSSLSATVHAIASSAEFDEEGLDVQFNPEKFQEHKGGELGMYFEIRLKDGRVIRRSDSLGGADLPLLGASMGKPEFRTIVLPDGKNARVIEIESAPDSEYSPGEYGDEEDGESGRSAWTPPTLVLSAARDLGQIEGQLNFLMFLLAGGGLGAMILAALLAFFIAQKGLAPLVSISEDISKINENDLGAHISTEKMPSEIFPVAEKLNDFIARIKEAFDREKCFSADIAHELRTPLAGLKTTLEVALSKERTAADYREALSDSLEVANTMNALVEKLLLLARIEGNKAEFRIEEIRVSETIENCWKPFKEEATRKNITFSSGIPSDLTVKSDRGGLTLVFTNILENAVQYANAGGKIWLEAKNTAVGTEFAFSNTGCTLSAEEIKHVFERFWRAEKSRTDTGTHLGIGLSFVERVVNSLGGKAEARVSGGGIFTVMITLP